MHVMLNCPGTHMVSCLDLLLQCFALWSARQPCAATAEGSDESRKADCAWLQNSYYHPNNAGFALVAGVAEHIKFKVLIYDICLQGSSQHCP